MKRSPNFLRKRVVIVEDESDLRLAFALIINSTERFAVTGVYGSVEDAVKQLKRDAPDIVLMDISLPGMSGIEGISHVKTLNFSCHVVMVTVFEDTDQVFKAFKAGADGYITKGMGHVELVNALEEVMKGGAPMSSGIARMVVEDFHRAADSPLSKRETEILDYVAKGKTFAQISEELFIARETVKSHVQNIYHKLQVSRRSDAIARASREKFI